MLKAHLQGKEIRPGQVNEILRKVEEVHGFELNPLLVTIFSATAQYGQSDLPANVTELFKKFTELMLGRWDEKKGLGQQIHMPIKDFLLRQIAYRMHCRQETEISKVEFRSVAYRELKSRGHAASTDDLLHEMVDRSGLFRVKDDVLEFRHHMLQEFFAGRGIPSLEDIKPRLHDDWWRRPIIFYFGENPENAATLEDVVTSAHGVDKRRNFEIAITAGLALQACYLASADAKIDLWKWVASSLGLGYEDFLKALSEYENYPTLNFLLAYLIARDSVALSLVRERRDELKEWSMSDGELVNSSSEHRLFWLATAFVEIGDMESFLGLIPEIKKLDLEYQFALFTGCSLVERVRAVDASTKKLAKEAQRKLIECVKGIGSKVALELGSQLLELRKGRLVAIDEEE